jgi:hypothetical protein
MAPDAHCINRLRAGVVLKDTTEEAINEYIQGACPECYEIPPNFSFRGITILLKKPMLVGLKPRKKKILMPFVKQCFGPMLIEVNGTEEEFSYIRSTLGPGGSMEKPRT